MLAIDDEDVAHVGLAAVRAGDVPATKSLLSRAGSSSRLTYELV